MPARKADRAVDDLYGLPLEEFTKRRDELARQLRKDGRRVDADVVNAARKPTTTAWALNQLARRRPKDVKGLLAAGRKLRKAHEGLLKGGDRAALQAASAEERGLVDELARDATTLAAEAGAASTAALDERIRNTLHAAALDDDIAAELAAGRLVREHEAVGMFGTAAGPAPAPRKQGPEKKRDNAQRRDLQRAVRAAKAEEQKAAREHGRAEKAVARAAKAADDAQKRADTARGALRAAEQRERETAQARDRANRAVAAAEKKLA
jgi:hypothetical protein